MIQCDGDDERLFFLSQIRSALGLPDDQYSFSALMGAAGREGDAKAVEAAFRAAWLAGLRSTYLCNTAMNNLVKARDPQVSARCTGAVFLIGVKSCAVDGITKSDIHS